MKKLTIAIATRNDEDTIADCISSCATSGLDIVVGDMGSRDRTAEIAQDMGAKVLGLAFRDDFSECKNDLISRCDSDWVLLLNGNEILARGAESIPNLASGANKRVMIVQSQVLTKPLRLVSKKSRPVVRNPVFDYIDGDGVLCDIFVKSTQVDKHEENARLVRLWMSKSPLLSQPHYYMSCIHLARASYSDFLKTAKHYLFLEKSKLSSYYMTKYYLSMVLAYHAKDYQESCRHSLDCIADKPTMAEYWCLLGDCYYSVDKFDKAYHLYENALIMGSRRSRDDSLPIHLDKYKSHPNNMMDLCRKALSSSRNFASSK